MKSSFEGALATSIKIGEEDVDIRVRFPDWALRREKSLNKVMIANRQGGLMPLSRVAYVKKRKGYSGIFRLNFRRIVQVQAQVNKDIITSIEANKILAKKFKDIGKKYPGYDIGYGGEQEDTDKNMSEMGDLFNVALMIIFIILAVFMGSLFLPLVVMIAIPFATVGVVLALFIHGEPMSFMSMLGIFSLAGVIVSNTLVLVQFINYERDKGKSLQDSLIDAGVIRLRPVILTA
ncbi:efflux RND transporter permease subunit, partial [Spirochaetota bacterium]